MLSLHELYIEMEKFAVSRGYQREEQGSGWWWKINSDMNDMELHEVIEYEFNQEKLDKRVDFCPQQFGWADTRGSHS